MPTGQSLKKDGGSELKGEVLVKLSLFLSSSSFLGAKEMTIDIKGLRHE